MRHFAFASLAAAAALAMTGSPALGQTTPTPSQDLRRNAPPDITHYARPAIPEDLRPMNKEQPPTIKTPSPEAMAATEAGGNGSIGLTTFSFSDGTPGKKGPKFLNYSDPSCPVSFSTTKISPLSVMGSHASFTGTAKMGRKTVSFTVQVDDNGPGSSDRFSITLSNGCSVSGNLTSGNIVFR